LHKYLLIESAGDCLRVSNDKGRRLWSMSRSCELYLQTEIILITLN